MTTLRVTDPRVRLGVGMLGLVASAAVVRRDRVGRREERVFRAVNRLPDSLFTPAWPVMQLGALGAAPAAAGVAVAAGQPELARRLLLGGTASWALSKVVKRGVRRPRPAALLPDARGRGREAAGLGYLSGHAAVAAALGTAVLPRVDAGWRLAVLAAVPVVGLCRIYVGAHLPLDVVGGAALGLVVESAVGLSTGSGRAQHNLGGSVCGKSHGGDDLGLVGALRGGETRGLRGPSSQMRRDERRLDLVRAGRRAPDRSSRRSLPWPW